MTMTKTMLRSAIEAVCGTEADGYVSLMDVLAGVTLAKAEDVLVNWLDANCSNGHFSRWTGFGTGMYRDFERVMKYLFSVVYGE